MTAPAQSKSGPFAFDDPAAAIDALTSAIPPVVSERVDFDDAAGRVLAEPLLADRDSPPHDASAMDGYAVRMADLGDAVRLPIVGEAVIGQPAPPLPAGQTVHIFTGGPVPAEADAVIRREDVGEKPDHITLRIDPSDIAEGANIRRQGENLPAGQTVDPAGELITPAVMAAAANFGMRQPLVFGRVRVAIIVTGDELLPIDAPAEPWQIRDSNGPALHAMLRTVPWLCVGDVRRVRDDLDTITRALSDALSAHDAVFLTGGVSVGDHDYVPDAVRAVGAEAVFHKLPIRPGKPLLTAVGANGQPILGLPGNPVSVLCTARRYGAPALRRRAGFTDPIDRPPSIQLIEADDKTLSLHWMRLVRQTGTGMAELVASRGSGDLVSAARGNGFVEVPAKQAGPGPWPFYSWGW